MRIQRKSGVIMAIASLIFCCSCEKHHLGEMPEVQKEHVDLARAAKENSGAAKETSTSPTPSAKPTPAEFFPESTPP
jgi:hypothetical protein